MSALVRPINFGNFEAVVDQRDHDRATTATSIYDTHRVAPAATVHSLLGEEKARKPLNQLLGGSLGRIDAVTISADQRMCLLATSNSVCVFNLRDMLLASTRNEQQTTTLTPVWYRGSLSKQAKTEEANDEDESDYHPPRRFFDRQVALHPTCEFVCVSTPRSHSHGPRAGAMCVYRLQQERERNSSAPPVHIVPSRINHACAFSPDGLHLALLVAWEFQVLRISSPQRDNWNVVLRVTELSIGRQIDSFLCFSHDGRRLYSLERFGDGVICVHNVLNKTQVLKKNVEPGDAPSPCVFDGSIKLHSLVGDTALGRAILHMTLSHDDSLLATLVEVTVREPQQQERSVLTFLNVHEVRNGIITWSYNLTQSRPDGGGLHLNPRVKISAFAFARVEAARAPTLMMLTETADLAFVNGASGEVAIGRILADPKAVTYPGFMAVARFSPDSTLLLTISAGDFLDIIRVSCAAEVVGENAEEVKSSMRALGLLP